MNLAYMWIRPNLNQYLSKLTSDKCKPKQKIKTKAKCTVCSKKFRSSITRHFDQLKLNKLLENYQLKVSFCHKVWSQSQCINGYQDSLWNFRFYKIQTVILKHFVWKIQNTVFPHIVSSPEHFPPLNSFLTPLRKLFKFLLHKGKPNEETIWNFQGITIPKKNSCRSNYIYEEIQLLVWPGTFNFFFIWLTFCHQYCTLNEMTFRNSVFMFI